MTTKEKLLELFETNRDVFFSGEDIAQKLAISRTAVWKAVKALQSEGYAIIAVTNRGYCLSDETDILSAQGIYKYLRPEIRDMEICVMDIVESTNTLVRNRQMQGSRRATLFLRMSRLTGADD